MLKRLLTHLRFLIFRKPRLEIDLELRFHLEQSIEANIASGMNPQEARRQALIALGGAERAKSECHAERPSFQIETVLQDIRYALRSFHRNRIFTSTIVLTLMLGIGCTTAVFSVVDRILFRSLPYEQADRLVSVGLSAPIAPQEFMLGGSYYEKVHSIAIIGGHADVGMISGGGSAQVAPQAATRSCLPVRAPRTGRITYGFQPLL